ncbi:hypothetical protein ACSW9O_00370 [Clostridium perfringens]|uniref:hypothetical protein n=1 Tax=Clostridium perfringens TaxID=1502 RepID=UPI0013E3942A|nr:hypothetical protein [Clostridium perfringens]MDU5248841.1 hypothetical protein [Clostridium perfringens]NGT84957.1 hypothetical protein [Clostridium perfringens]BDA35681.1 hypothetical protein CPBEC5_26890 [Clostridium perfringens]HAT4349055.1 hypothetical protein [Clostridium perfringens]HCG3019275.1 hypothetical protein [Clostridium perfringens]
MKCVINFLSDMHQKSLRRLAQVQCEGYENCINQYKELFIVNFLDVKCKCQSSCENCENCEQFIKIIDEIKKEDIEKFFDSIKDVYIKWIDAKTRESIDIFEKLLNEYDILDVLTEDIEKDIFFKGRKEKNILTKWDMFHIPFNKRYLIQNQRYSLTGQPIIYLGKSIVDIVEELSVEDEIDLKISSFQIRDGLKIYDLRNNIFNDITKKSVSEFLGSNNSTFDRRKFFKNILSSICSFERRREYKKYSFCEEYVIPQILAQIIKNQGYDGIIYYSTKRFNNIKFNDDNGEVKNKYEVKTKYKENLALFTNFNDEHVYDRDLYDQLKISVPIDISKVENISIEDLEKIYNKIKNTGIKNINIKSDIILSSFKREFNCMNIDKNKYSETYMGKLHIYHIYCILNEMLCETVKG